MNLSLERIKIKNFRKIIDLDIVISEKKNVICFVGPNGSGKSSLLSLIVKSLSDLTNEKINNSTNDDENIIYNRVYSANETNYTKAYIHGVLINWKTIEQTLFWKYVNNSYTELNNENVLEIKNEFQFGNINQGINSDSNKPSIENDVIAKNVLLYRPFNRFETPYYEDFSKKFINPSIASRWENIRPLPVIVKSGINEMEQFILDIILDSYIDDISKYESIEKLIFGLANPTKTEVEQLFNFSNLIPFITFLKEIDVNFNRLQVTKFPYRRIGTNNINALSLLSTGELDILVTISNIVAQKKYIVSKFPKINPQGIVIIDEIDAHLHPQLQERIVPLLIELFPDLFFIITTHSPFVIRSLKKESSAIYRLPDGNLFDLDFASMKIEDIIEILFQSTSWSNEIKKQIEIFENLILNEPIDIPNIILKYRELSVRSESLRSYCDKLIAINGNSNIINALYNETN